MLYDARWAKTVRIRMLQENWHATRPVAPPEKVKPRQLNEKRRQHLIERIVLILDRGEPSKFAFEGSCRRGLRSSFVLAGWRWAEADATAADILAAAFREIGAQRPTWLDGQPSAFQDGASIPRERCLGCGQQLLGDVTERFCSRPCKGIWRRQINAKWQSATAEAEKQI